MGVLNRGIKAILPQARGSYGAAIPTWQEGVTQYPRVPQASYSQLSLEGYSRNELAYACIEIRSSSVAEPVWAAYSREASGLVKLNSHPAIDLLENPNPFMGRYEFLAALQLYRDIGGNAYVEKVYSRAGKLVELWPLRPDRMWAIPSSRTHVRGYEYRLEGITIGELPVNEVIHIKARNPLDDFYGLAPLAVAAARVDQDNWMRQFTGAFFKNAGVPAGLLMVKRALQEEERAAIQRRFRVEHSGPGGWHNLLILEDEEVDYKPMGMPLGERGLVLPSLDEFNEARIAMTFEVPLSLLGARLGLHSSSYANKKSDREMFTEICLSPLWQEYSSALSRAILPDFGGADVLAADMSTVRALQEDEDKRHERARKNVESGLWTREEGRAFTGQSAEPQNDGVYLIPVNYSQVPASQSTPAAIEKQQVEDAAKLAEQEAAKQQSALAAQSAQVAQSDQIKALVLEIEQKTALLASGHTAELDQIKAALRDLERTLEHSASREPQVINVLAGQSAPAIRKSVEHNERGEIVAVVEEYVPLPTPPTRRKTVQHDQRGKIVAIVDSPEPSTNGHGG